MRERLKKFGEAVLWAAAAIALTMGSEYFASVGLTEVAAVLLTLAAWFRRSPNAVK